MAEPAIISDPEGRARYRLAATMVRNPTTVGPQLSSKEASLSDARQGPVEGSSQVIYYAVAASLAFHVALGILILPRHVALPPKQPLIINLVRQQTK